MNIMKIWMMATLVLLGLSAIAQEAPKAKTLTGEMYCKNKDYQFLIEGNYYFDNKKVYVCPKNIPLDIAVVDALNQLPVSATFQWRINGAISSVISNTLTINVLNFIGDQVGLECEFTDDATGITTTLRLEIRKDIKLIFKESARNYQFDDNKIQAYIDEVGYGEALGIPWNFIESEKFDILKSVVTKGKGVYAVDSIMLSDTLLSANPDFISMRRQNITFEFTGSGQKVIEARGCHSSDPELLLFTEDKKKYTVNFIRVCETDDDIQVRPVGTTVTSATDVCIDGGVDLTIDEMDNPSFVNPNDVLEQNSSTGKWSVLAGADLVCNTQIHPAGLPDCPNFFNTTAYIDATNNILKKIAIEVVDGGTTTINFNYDTFSEGDGMQQEEQRALHDSRHGTLGLAPTIEVYLVNDLGGGITGIGSVQGRASYRGKNTIAIDVNDAMPRVLVHELGHAKWSLLHPGCPCSATILGEFNMLEDKYNFMHGITNEILGWNIRRYQFELMH